VAQRAQSETLSYEQYLLELSARECAVRRAGRIERLLRQSQLPLEKSLERFDLKRLPPKVARQVRTLLAERYERGSVLLSSNLPFSKWEQIFKDPMTTAAAIDRLVHHSIILELNISSYRLEQAKAAQEKE
jgi:DNA replication protein DnaC